MGKLKDYIVSSYDDPDKYTDDEYEAYWEEFHDLIHKIRNHPFLATLNYTTIYDQAEIEKEHTYKFSLDDETESQ